MSRRRFNNRGPGRSLPQPPYGSVPAFIDTALTPPRAGLTETATVKRMAEDMREAAYREGGVSETDLLGRGYTPAQIKLHGDAARKLAQQLAGASL